MFNCSYLIASILCMCVLNILFRRKSSFNFLGKIESAIVLHGEYHRFMCYIYPLIKRFDPLFYIRLKIEQMEKQLLQYVYKYSYLIVFIFIIFGWIFCSVRTMVFYYNGLIFCVFLSQHDQPFSNNVLCFSQSFELLCFQCVAHRSGFGLTLSPGCRIYYYLETRKKHLQFCSQQHRLFAETKLLVFHIRNMARCRQVCTYQTQKKTKSTQKTKKNEKYTKFNK